MKRYHLQNKNFKERTTANKLVYNKQQNFCRRLYKKHLKNTAKIWI